ncbi:hypothetical protein HYPSUDRAFT_209743 [Hypholoma sublateritium FD-334 SS-4]|uniref:Uncharacterized protein n=1 Tax=Hypholoma sublateritium (strain FD-334 SS-4) TaxID=945553 RepID=A0A0D2N968_HYPSF|nr:hypothetical protein HYPSUDRAFT_209743 [Hypholoma sublateritium FD-334 SS-4]
MPAERHTRKKGNPVERDVIVISDGEDDLPPVEEAFLGYLEKKQSQSAKKQKKRRLEKKHDDLLKQLARAEETNEKLTSSTLCAAYLFSAHAHPIHLQRPVGVDPLPLGDPHALCALRVNPSFDTEDNSAGTGPAWQLLFWLERMLRRKSSALGEVTLQDYTNYFTDDVYVSVWMCIVAMLGDRTRFRHFRTFVVDSKHSVTEKIR